MRRVLTPEQRREIAIRLEKEKLEKQAQDEKDMAVGCRFLGKIMLLVVGGAVAVVVLGAMVADGDRGLLRLLDSVGPVELILLLLAAMIVTPFIGILFLAIRSGKRRERKPVASHSNQAVNAAASSKSWQPAKRETKKKEREPMDKHVKIALIVAAAVITAWIMKPHPMKIILFIVLTLLLFLVITTLFKQSYNVLFFFLKKPILWIVFVGMLNFLVFYISSLAPKSYYVVLWASLVAFFDNLPPKNKVMTKAELNGLSDEMLDIKSSRLKYRIGLFSYALGGFLGWLVFFGKIEVVSM